VVHASSWAPVSPTPTPFLRPWARAVVTVVGCPLHCVGWPGSTWRYLDTGTNQGTAWRALSFEDAHVRVVRNLFIDARLVSSFADPSSPPQPPYSSVVCVAPFFPLSPSSFTSSFSRYLFSFVRHLPRGKMPCSLGLSGNNCMAHHLTPLAKAGYIPC
jgi:hypothetical protein